MIFFFFSPSDGDQWWWELDIFINRSMYWCLSSPEFAYSAIYLQTVDGLSDLHFSGGHNEIESRGNYWADLSAANVRQPLYYLHLLCLRKGWGHTGEEKSWFPLQCHFLLKARLLSLLLNEKLYFLFEVCSNASLCRRTLSTPAQPHMSSMHTYWGK